MNTSSRRGAACSANGSLVSRRKMRRHSRGIRVLPYALVRLSLHMYKGPTGHYAKGGRAIKDVNESAI